MTTTKSRPQPNIRYGDAVTRQIAAHATPAEIAAVSHAYATGAKTITASGATSYCDAGSDERYTAGYGGERSSAPVRDFTPSDAQIRFLDGLLAEREHAYTVEQIAQGKADWRKIRPMLNELKVSARRDPRARKTEAVEVPVAAPVAPARDRLNFAEILDGYYALRAADGVIKFYRVSTSKSGGYKNVQAQASDQLFPLRGNAGIAVMHRLVEAGLKDSQKLYADELGRCYVCGRTLTDEASRAAGIGPICVNR